MAPEPQLPESAPTAPQPKPKMGWQVPAVLLTAVALVALALFAVPRPKIVGDLPQFQLVKLDGSAAQLEGGKPVVMTVWATWCGYCQQQLPQFEEVARRNPNVQFAFVNDGEAPQLVRQFHDTRGFTNAVVYQDVLRQVSQSLRVNGYPANFFFNAKGQKVGEVRGYMSGEQLQAALAQLN
jgi:thiol-disulfide isomerase/thioredoxin